ncbi:MAG: hypothetical protein ACU841_03565 [Gammaproteobacteria bacterium]
MNGEHKHVVSSGVEALIQKLKDQGITAGQEKAEQIVADAQKRAEWIIQEAEREARLLLDNARAESEMIKAAGQDALNLAARDAFLKVRDHLLASFSRELTRVVGQEMNKEEFLRQLMLELAGRLRQEVGLDHNRNIRVLIPDTAVDMEDLRRHPEHHDRENLSRLTAAIAADLLKEGVHIEVSDELSQGLLIRLEDDHVAIDFTDETVSALLLKHLQPRFRAILQGVIR